MKKYITILTFRTLISLIIAIATLFFAYKYELYFNIDLTLISIAIIFPLVFNIRGSFRRREKALEHLSQYRSALKTIHYLFLSNPNLSESDKQKISDILIDISDKVISHLRNNKFDTKSTPQQIRWIDDRVGGNLSVHMAKQLDKAGNAKIAREF